MNKRQMILEKFKRAVRTIRLLYRLNSERFVSYFCPEDVKEDNIRKIQSSPVFSESTNQEKKKKSKKPFDNLVDDIIDVKVKKKSQNELSKSQSQRNISSLNDKKK
jgi:hypothetical protein